MSNERAASLRGAPDFTIEPQGELRLVRPHSQPAYCWLRANSDSDRTWFEGALVIDCAQLGGLIEHMLREGFIV